MSKLYPPGLGVVYEPYRFIRDRLIYMFPIALNGQLSLLSIWSNVGNTIVETYDEKKWTRADGTL